MKDDAVATVPKGPKPETEHWYMAAYSLAQNFVSIYPCPRCNWPVARGYTLGNCKCPETK